MTAPTIEELKQFFPLCNLPPLLLKHLTRLARVEETRSDKCVFTQSEKDGTVYYLMEGEVRIDQDSGSTSVLQGHTPQAHFPLSANQPHQATATTLTEAKIIRLPWELLHNLNQLPGNESTPSNQGIELVEENPAENDLYLDFYDEMRQGNLELPSMPDLAVRIIRTVDNPDTDSSEIAKVILLDPSLVTRIINVVNSPAFMGHTTIDNCPDAVTRMGRNTTRNLVISFALKHLFKSKSKILNLRMRELWRHSSKVAAISYTLAKLTPGLSPDNAMLSGIIHDIGTIPLLSAARNYPQLMKDTGLLDHAIKNLRGEIGGMVLKQWGFAEEYIDVTTHAESWMDDRAEKPTYTDLVIVAQLHSYVGTPMMQEVPRLDLVPAFHKLALGKLTPQHSIRVLDKAKKDIQAIESLLQS